MNFLDFIGESPSLTITINGHAIIIQRVRFGLHLKLSMIEARIRKISETNNAGIHAESICEDIIEYLLLSGISEYDISIMGGIDIIMTYLQVSAFNAMRIQPAFMTEPKAADGEHAEPLPYDYDGRYWAWFIAKLASRYSWSEKEILDLTPEAAAYYLQEALVMDYHDAEFEHQLSEVSYGYDKESQKPIYHPLPMPHWMDGKVDDEPEMFRIRRDFLPAGAVVTVADLEKK